MKRRNYQLELRTLPQRLVYFNNLRLSFLCIILSSLIEFACDAVHADAFDGWMWVDHNGVVSSKYHEKASIPKWPGWTEKVEHGFGGDSRYRSKMNADGSELRYSYTLLKPPCADRIKIASISPQGSTRDGFVDATGRIVIRPKYMWADDFYDGLVAVREKKGEPWILLDINGAEKYKLPTDMKPNINRQFAGVSKEGLLPVQKGDIDAPFCKGVDGLYDLAKQKFFPLGTFTSMDEFSEGLCLFRGTTPALSGYVDVHGKVAIPQQFDEADKFENGVALVRLGKQRGLIDHSGRFVAKLPEQYIKIDNFREGLAAVMVKGAQGVPNVGFIDKTGKLVIPAIYYAKVDRNMFWSAPRFSEGVANVAIGDEVHHQYGFINKQGNWKILPKFREAYWFEDGYAQVKTGTSGFNKDEWNSRKRGEESFRVFVKQYGLFGMSRTAIKSMLGKADRRYIDSDLYTLNDGACNHSYRGVEIHYDNDKVTKYRALASQKRGQWIDHAGDEATKWVYSLDME
ncbi:MAG: WG repeat-containing protein [Candidatus Obscuribacterales bacterium]|nr:WG repeat-containing protein [Candidatus Obscuribacterales bacterium]